MDRSGPGRDGVNAVLEHFGVKGMKWGVRRSTSTSTPISDDAARAHTVKTTIKRGGTKAVSNADLQALVTRMNLERQYKQLNPSKGQKVAQFVATTMIGIGKQELTKLATEVTAKQVAGLLKNKK